VNTFSIVIEVVDASLALYALMASRLTDNFNLSIVMDWLQRGARSRSHGVASCPTQVVVFKMEAFASFEPSRADYFSATYSNRGNHILAPVKYPSVYMMCCLVTDQGYVESVAPHQMLVNGQTCLGCCMQLHATH